MPVPTSRLQDLVRRIQMEYIEMPGLALTRGQARRLWNLDADVCDEVLAVLMAEEFLGQTTRGAFFRRASGKEFTRASHERHTGLM